MLLKAEPMAVTVSVSVSAPGKNQKKNKRRGVVCAVTISNAKTRERESLMEEIEERLRKIRENPMEGVPFDLEQFSESLANNDGVNCEIGSTVISLNSKHFVKSNYNYQIVSLCTVMANFLFGCLGNSLVEWMTI
jgi:hypothetical protein